MNRRRTLELLTKILVYEGRLPSNLVRFVRSHPLLVDAINHARTLVAKWAPLRSERVVFRESGRAATRRPDPADAPQAVNAAPLSCGRLHRRDR
jgi:hypothetical protein